MLQTKRNISVFLDGEFIKRGNISLFVTKTYYFDACTWRDHFEDRISKRDRPLGSFANRLLMNIIAEKGKILFSDIVVKELTLNYALPEIEEMFQLLTITGTLNRLETTEKQFEEAIDVAIQRKVPRADALNAILARDNGAVLITADKHRHLLRDIAEAKMPEELL
jgi:predicted nucleic acid-binding protein